MKDVEIDVDIICKNCQHLMSMHTPHCEFLLDNHDHKTICDCNNAEFYNAIISGKYIGRTKINCNKYGNILAFIDSPSENIYNFNILCKNALFTTIDSILLFLVKIKIEYNKSIL
jgi:hypothetical protein